MNRVIDRTIDFSIITSGTFTSKFSSPQDWLRVRKRFVECFLLQKTAYRRANGGSTAPSLHEDPEKCWISSG